MKLNNAIDHTLLKPEATRPMIERLCLEAQEHEFAAVCVSPVYVEYAASLLKGSPVRVATVVGFSSGAMLSETKALEAQMLVALGAHEIDMVMAVWALKNGELALVEDDIRQVVDASLKANPQTQIKVIIETGLLTTEEIVTATELCLKAGAHFVKTCTGFHGGQAEVEHIALISSVLKGRAKIKASGGIRTFDQACALLKAGASRLGTSSGVALVKGLQGADSY
jgi:deoxyribose-phosphate aldolase